MKIGANKFLNASGKTEVCTRLSEVSAHSCKSRECQGLFYGFFNPVISNCLIKKKKKSLFRALPRKKKGNLPTAISEVLLKPLVTSGYSVQLPGK